MEKALDQAEKANIPECIMSFITFNLMMCFLTSLDSMYMNKRHAQLD